MEIAYHALEMFEAPADEIRDAIRQWLTDAGFKVAPSSPSDLDIRAQRGSAIGVTDHQTGRVMEIIIRSSGGVTAVSVYHHTSRLGPFVGTTFSDLLRDEVNAMLASLGEMVTASR
jgi:hypothetical protein